MNRPIAATIAVVAVIALAGCATLTGGEAQPTEEPPGEQTPAQTPVDTPSGNATPDNGTEDNDTITLPEGWETPTERETPASLPSPTDVEGSPPPIDDEPELTPTPTPEETPTPTPTPSVEASDLDIEVNPRVETVDKEFGGVERVYRLEGEVSNPTNHSVEFGVGATIQTEDGTRTVGMDGGERLTPGEDTPISGEYSPAHEVIGGYDLHISVSLSDNQ